MNNKKPVITIFLSIILFTVGAIAILVGVVNTLSHNKAFTTKIVNSQIHRLLDLDSKVENPHAYLDWDLQYKIRADKLTFINNSEDLISVENLHVNVFVPYLALKKIYITQMSGKNLFVNFERYENKKINILEIFNISGFFKIYFHNSTISIDKYFIKFTDNFYKPSEKMTIQGKNILFTKFTLNKYFQLIMDGNINYNKKDTFFSIDYNAKIPTIKKDFNFEIRLPNFNLETFKKYIKEIEPTLTLKGKGNLKLKVSSAKFINIDATLKDADVNTPKIPYALKFKDAVHVKSRFSYEHPTRKFVFDELRVKGKDYGASAHGILEYVGTDDATLDFYVKIDENSNGNSALKVTPSGIKVLYHILDKAKKYNLGAIAEGQAYLKGKIGYLNAYGYVKARNINLGYGYDYPNSYANIKLFKDKMYLEAKYYPNKNPNEFADVQGEIKITKPFATKLDIKTPKNVDLKSTQRALNIFSDLFNFKTGPVPIMGIHQGTGEIKLNVKYMQPLAYLTGKMYFRNGIASYPDLSGKIYDVSGEIDFNNEEIIYKNIKGQQDGVWAYANGNTLVNKDGLTHFYLKLTDVPLDKAKVFVDNSPLIEDVATAIQQLKNPSGLGSINMVMISDKNTVDEPRVEGAVFIKEGTCDIEGLGYPATNINGNVKFTNEKSILDFTGKMHGVNAIVTGYARPEYSEIYITTPQADAIAAKEFVCKSPLLEQSHKAFDDFPELTGTVRTKTKLYGNLSSTEPLFQTEISIIQGSLKYLDIPEYINVSSGNIIASQDKVILNNIKGTTMNAPFVLNGTITDAGLKTEKSNLIFSITGLDVSKVSKLVGTQVLTPEANKILSELTLKSGYIDVKSYITEKTSTANIIFDNATAILNRTQDIITVKAGEFFYSDNLLNLKRISANMSNSELLIDGTIKNHLTNPIFNLELASNLAEVDFNKTISTILNAPLKLIGKIYTNIKIKGDINNWHLKMRAMLDDNSYILYKDANLGEDLSKYLFFDITGKENEIAINTFDVYSPHTATSQNRPSILAQIKGKIKNIKTATPYIDNLNVEFNDYMNISFLNILFYDPQKQPFLKTGLIKGKVLLNGDTKNLSIIGNADVKNAIIPEIDTTVEKMDIVFNEKIIEIKDALVNIAGSVAKINATMKNKFVTPITINKLHLDADFINADALKQNFTKLFAYKSQEDDNIPIQTKSALVVIDEGTIKIKDFIYKTLNGSDLSADFYITPQWDFAIQNIKGNITTGCVNGEIFYNLYSTDLSGNLEAQNVDANTFATALLNLPNEMYGQLNANAKFSTKGKTQNQIIENLDGVVYFNLQNGRMIRLGSVEYMLKTLNTFKGGLTRLNLNALVNIVAPKTGYFDSIEGDFQIQDGTIISDKITSKSKELNLFMTGSYDINNSMVNGTIIGQLPIESKESILWLGTLGKISLNSLVKYLTKQNAKENDNFFFTNPLSYINDIPGLKNNKGDYRFFVITLDGNLYENNYVDKFKWIK